MTEACLLTGVEYKSNQDKATVEEILRRLSKMTDAHIIITSCNLNGTMGVISFKDNSIKYYQIDKQEANAFGTGDLFSAVIFGCLKLGKNMDESIKTAIKFTSICLEETIKTRSTYEGVVFHSKIKELQKLI
jgi:pyridoxine kinase